MYNLRELSNRSNRNPYQRSHNTDFTSNKTITYFPISSKDDLEDFLMSPARIWEIIEIKYEIPIKNN